MTKTLSLRKIGNYTCMYFSFELQRYCTCTPKVSVTWTCHRLHLEMALLSMYQYHRLHLEMALLSTGHVYEYHRLHLEMTLLSTGHVYEYHRLHLEMALLSTGHVNECCRLHLEMTLLSPGHAYERHRLHFAVLKPPVFFDMIHFHLNPLHWNLTLQKLMVSYST